MFERKRGFGVANQESLKLLSGLYEAYDYVFVVLFSKVPAGDMFNFRKELRASESVVCVVKNSLNRIAVSKFGREKLSPYCVGQALTVFSSDLIEASKIICDYSKSGFEVVSCATRSGEIFSKEDVVRLSKIPPLPVLQSTLLATINAPASSFVRALSEVPSSFVRVLDAKSRA